MTTANSGHASFRGDIFAQALNSLTVHVAVLDDEGQIVAVNDAWRAFAAANGADGHPSILEGANYFAGSDGADDADAQAAAEGIRRVLGGELDELLLEYPCHSPSEQRWFLLRATPLRRAQSRGAVVVHSTITERKLAPQRLQFLAHHDELTGLPNRRGLMEALSGAHATGRLGVLLVDLDHFKDVNDTYGHAAGNDVLCAVADALSLQLPGGSIAGRHGGDEFCVGLFDTDVVALQGAAAELCARTRHRLSRLSVAHAATVSIGGTLVDPSESLALALERADQALYAVKGHGRDGFDIR